MGPDEEAAAAGAAPAAAILREKSAFVSLIPCVSHGRAADLAGVTADADPKAPPVVAEADDTGADGKANPDPVVAGAPNTGAAEAVDDGLVSPELRAVTADPNAPPVVAACTIHILYVLGCHIVHCALRTIQGYLIRHDQPQESASCPYSTISIFSNHRC